jgi:hypothetical protein
MKRLIILLVLPILACAGPGIRFHHADGCCRYPNIRSTDSDP